MSLEQLIEFERYLKICDNEHMKASLIRATKASIAKIKEGIFILDEESVTPGFEKLEYDARLRGGILAHWLETRITTMWTDLRVEYNS